MVELDEKDQKILDLLQTDASLPMSDVAAAVGLSPSPCWRRVRRLEETGVIKARVALVDRTKIGPSLTAYAFISLDRHEDNLIDQFHAAIQSAPEVTNCAAVTGAVDFLLVVVVPDMEAYERFLRRRLLGLTMIRSINTSFMLREVKSSTAVPIRARSTSD